jgi:hypothetical protein
VPAALPFPPSSKSLGIDDEEFRELLRAEIERRLHERDSAAAESRAAHS